MYQKDDAAARAVAGGGMIRDAGVRELYEKLCIEIVSLDDSIEVEAAPFETRFTGPPGMRVAVSPYRDLFMVSVGEKTPVQIRVCDRGGWCQALDLAISEFLSRKSEILNY